MTDERDNTDEGPQTDGAKGPGDGTGVGFDTNPTPFMSDEALDATAGSSAPDDLGSTDTGSGLTAGGEGTAIPGLDEARR